MFRILFCFYFWILGFLDLFSGLSALNKAHFLLFVASACLPPLLYLHLGPHPELCALVIVVARPTSFSLNNYLFPKPKQGILLPKHYQKHHHNIKWPILLGQYEEVLALSLCLLKVWCVIS